MGVRMSASLSRLPSICRSSPTRPSKCAATSLRSSGGRLDTAVVVGGVRGGSARRSEGPPIHLSPTRMNPCTMLLSSSACGVLSASGSAGAGDNRCWQSCGRRQRKDKHEGARGAMAMSHAVIQSTGAMDVSVVRLMKDSKDSSKVAGEGAVPVAHADSSRARMLPSTDANRGAEWLAPPPIQSTDETALCSHSHSHSSTAVSCFATASRIPVRDTGSRPVVPASARRLAKANAEYWWTGAGLLFSVADNLWAARATHRPRTWGPCSKMVTAPEVQHAAPSRSTSIIRPTSNPVPALPSLDAIN
mmetsp:Transcript_14530/g.24028  ORF Transcript_14530/g.24028 Transcript_14530/m.24028 type:complete len:304 (-) Transcript_14530:1979-2890(-)